MDAIIVLGGSIDDDGRLGPDSVSRVDKGINVFRKDKASKLIMSGAYSFLAKIRPRVLEAVSMKKYAVAKAIPSKNIIVEQESLDTLSNLFFSKKIIRRYGWKKIAIVTSDYHLKRTRYAASKIFGNSYDIAYYGSHVRSGLFTVFSDYLKEFIYYFLYRIYLGRLEPGNDDEMKKFLYKKHPAYKTIRM